MLPSYAEPSSLKVCRCLPLTAVYCTKFAAVTQTHSDGWKSPHTAGNSRQSWMCVFFLQP